MTKTKLIRFVLSALCCVALCAGLAGCGGTEKSSSSSSSSSSSVVVSDVAAETEPFYVLIVGNDTRKGTPDISDPIYADGVGHADTMMVARIDPVKFLVTLVSIPRDTVIELNGAKTNITDSYANGGITNAVAAAEAVTGKKMKYYFNCTFVQFEELVNGMGGVTADVPITMSLDNVVQGGRTYLDAGEQDLNGTQALAFARMRKQYAVDIEACRQIQDRQLVMSLMQKAINNPSQVAAYEAVLLSSTETNMPKNSLSKLVSSFAENATKVTFISGTGPYTVGEPDDYYNNWYCPFDADTWAEVMAVVDAGGDPTTVVSLPDVSAA